MEEKKEKNKMKKAKEVIDEIITNEKSEISKLYQELKDFRRAPYICIDCINGKHEISGNQICDCICHNNPACFVCGCVLIKPEEIAAVCHSECELAYEEQEANHESNNDMRYDWEI